MNAVLLVRDKQSFIPHGIRTSVLMDSHVTDSHETQGGHVARIYFVLV